ncbi:ABC transporter permease [Halomonas ramblicola]|nr:ABC transporter permease [Halomonas ramblicola]MDN3520453.1 ABC transporter permease [Halomonas ramblicola]
MILSALVGPELYPHDPYAQNLSNRLLPPGSEAAEGLLPHYLGTDALGRDVVARLLSGARVSIAVGFAGVVVSGLLGITVGLVAGYFRGRVEDVLMRLSDLQESFPALILALFILYALGPGLANLLLVMAIARWPTYARVSRSLALGLRDNQYIEAARALGASPARIIREHVLVNARSPLVILATLELARVILFESTLSFLGFGIQPPDTSWGLMISEGREYLGRAPWLIIVPGLAIFATALSANLIASWGQNVTDPIRRAEWLRRGLVKEKA